MPEIARFYGIVIKMFFKPKEHEPSQLVKEWMEQHQKDLLDMWETQNLKKLPPL